MRWRLSFRRWHSGDFRREVRLIWEWIEALKPLNPSLASWRPLRMTREESEVAPPLTYDMVEEAIEAEHAGTDSFTFTLTIGICGTLTRGNRLESSFMTSEPPSWWGANPNGNANVEFDIGEDLGNDINADHNLADTLMRTTATILNPTIGSLCPSDWGMQDIQLDRPYYPFSYSPGWKMFFHHDSPHHQQATQIATATTPIDNGTITTFGTPDTYLHILNQW